MHYVHTCIKAAFMPVNARNAAKNNIRVTVSPKSSTWVKFYPNRQLGWQITQIVDLGNRATQIDDLG